MTTSTLSFNASSTFAAGVGAHVNVIVDGQLVGSTYVATTATDYSFAVTLAPNTAHDVQLVYDNDAVIGGQDRNLLLNSMTVNGQVIAANSSSEVYHAQGQGDIASSGNMIWAGTAEFSLPASDFASQTTTPPASTGTASSSSSGAISTISFNASSTFAAGVGAHVNVIVDGQLVGSTYVGATAADYSFAVTFAPNTAHDIQLVYDNDAVIGGQDRNLLLNSVTVNGQTIAANGSSEVYHAQGQGDIASSGNMLWMGTAEFSLPASVFTAQSTGTAGATTTGTTTATTASSSNTISFNASATLAAGIGAHVTVIVDGQNVGSTYVGATAADYSFAVTLAPNTAHDIQLVYDNDAVIGGQDRNLLLNSITVNGQIITTNSSSEVYHAQGQGDIASSGNMLWMGTAEFSLPASNSTTQTTGTTGGTGSGTTGTTTTTPTAPATPASPSNTISFNASATLAGGVGAHVNVIVDGQNVGSTYVGATAADYSFNVTFAPNTAHDVQLVYDNDAVVGGQDRNLQLNSITVNGQTIAANSSAEVYHASGQGDIASSGAMNWSGTAEFSLPASLFPATSTGTVPVTTSSPGFYVSTSGSDSGDGSAAHPFATLTKAVSAMEGNSSVHTTYLEGGTYNLTSTVNLGTADNGMTIQAAAGAAPVLDGGGSLQALIQLNGASGVTLQGLTFQDTVGRGAVTLNGAGGNNIIADHFLNNGEGIFLDNGSDNNLISGNEIDNSAASAVEVQDGSSGNRFDSNVVNGTGAIGTQGGGFFLHGVNNNTISNNLVENTAGMGIGVENWDSTTINVGNSITGNIVENSNTSASSTDSGAIYELGRSQVDTQSIISDNYITEPSQPVTPNAQIVGIYLDDLTDGVKVTNNIIVGVIAQDVQIHGGNNVIVQNNIFDLGANSGLSWGKGSAVLFQYQTADSGAADPMANNVVTQNIIASSSPTPLAYSSIDGGAPVISSNFYMDLLNSQFRSDGTALSQSNAQYGNAQFANQAAGDYTLGSNSGALTVGFGAIDQSSMGPHPATAAWYGNLGKLIG